MSKLVGGLHFLLQKLKSALIEIRVITFEYLECELVTICISRQLNFGREAGTQCSSDIVLVYC